LVDLEDEFSSLNPGDGSAGDDPDAAWRVAMKKREDTSEQLQAGSGICSVRGQDFELSRRAEGYYALVRPTERDTAVGTGSQPVARLQDLVGAGEDPVCGARRRNFHFALGFHDANFVGGLGLAALGGLPTRQPRANRKPAKNHGQQNLSNGS
jgi:hypothetical protein